jgi:prolipoprotein diacylglyceryltransferase
MPAVLTLAFDPWVGVGDLRLRWEALALALVLLVALALWVRALRAEGGSPLRWADVAFVIVATVTGAVVGGRAVHALDFLDAYALDPVAAFDLGRGSASLMGAVLGGMAAGAIAGRLAGVAIGAWADAAALPLLVAIGGGKLALLLGGGGQGEPWDGAWAVAFSGSGPWRSIDPAVAGWPSQALEGVWALLGIPVVWLVGRRLAGGPHARHGLLLLLAVSWWLGGRAVVALTWRDAPKLGPLGTEGAATLVAFVGVAAALSLLVVARRRRGVVS